MSSRILLQVLFTSALVTVSADAAAVNLSIRLGDSVPADLGLTTGMTLSGRVTYNASLVPTTGGTTLTPVNDSTLTINLTLAGTLFDQDHDVEPHHPASAGAGYVQIETNLTGTSFNYSFDGLSDYTGEVSWMGPVSPAPEPSTALLIGLASLITFRRSIRR
ncbi:MAG: hypothetical protein CFE26_02790 [Verrucomicrobiales bacterium VVV1]|nr:MAG: hypothetical protein CFE26_02790 [Verrucomicrobiales bacterium VVV1]